MSLRDAAVAAAVMAAAAACAGVRWKAHPASTGDLSWDPLGVSSSTAAAQAPAREPVPAREPTPDTLYYSDLGPDAVDVSGYPTQQKYDYGIYARVCSQCHTLARSINVPAVSRAYWEFYIARMKLHTRLARETRISQRDLAAIVDFLDYDARQRKVSGRRDFERQQAVLKERFDEMLRQRLERLQLDDQPKILERGAP